MIINIVFKTERGNPFVEGPFNLDSGSEGKIISEFAKYLANGNPNGGSYLYYADGNPRVQAHLLINFEHVALIKGPKLSEE